MKAYLRRGARPLPGFTAYPNNQVGEYYVIGMDFQVQMSHAKFRSENAFSLAFAKAFV